MFLVYLAIFFLLANPAAAYAWGPGIHLDIAVTVLNQASLCLPAIAALIKKYPNEFIYGSVSPDIITGKKYAGAIHHCHNWSVGRLVLGEAKTEPEKASAWGYLTHLAADTVAHNYFVPYYNVLSFPARTLGHPYWEMRFDLLVPDSSWRHLAHVIRRDYSPFDHLLERVLKKTLFSFSTNKKIFNSILILHKMKRLRFGLRSYGKISRWPLLEEDIGHFRQLAMETVFDFLKEPEKARCLKADPAGLRKLLYGIELGRELRSAVKKKRTTPKRVQEFLAEVKKGLLVNLFDETKPLPHIQTIL